MELKHRMQVYHLANEQFFEYHHQSKQLFFSASDQPDAQDQTAALLLEKGRLPQASEEALKTVILEQRTGSAEIELLCGDGHRHWLRLIMENVNDGLNNPMYTIGKLQLIDQEKQEKDQLLEQVRRDGLTNLYHAKTLRQQISEVLAQTQSSASGVLFILDIDYFKAINDTFGHPKGDWVLKQVAQTLEENFVQKLHKAYVEVSGDTESQPQAIGGGTYAKSMPNCVAFGCEFKDEDNAIHGNNENIKIDSLLKSTEIFAKAIYDLIKE